MVGLDGARQLTVWETASSWRPGFFRSRWSCAVRSPVKQTP